MTTHWLLDTSALLALLVHKDPEFRGLDQLSQEWLG
jgi:hypothetical protein